MDHRRLSCQVHTYFAIGLIAKQLICSLKDPIFRCSNKIMNNLLHTVLPNYAPFFETPQIKLIGATSKLLSKSLELSTIYQILIYCTVQCSANLKRVGCYISLICLCEGKKVDSSISPTLLDVISKTDGSGGGVQHIFLAHFASTMLLLFSLASFTQVENEEEWIFFQLAAVSSLFSTLMRSER